MRRCTSLVLALLLALAGCGRPTTSNTSSPEGKTVSKSGRLAAVLNRNQLLCGVSGELPGFSFVDPTGEYLGLDVDICRAIAAALFNNPNAVEFRNLNAKERFTALQTGEIDVLSRNTTWTINRDTAVRLDFAPVVFYDGQGMMVRKDSGIKTLEDLKGKAICTQIGTTNEQNLADQMRKRNLDYTPVTYEDVNAAYTAYIEGRCAGVTSDRSQLVSRRSAFPNPADHVILDNLLSKEPLAPAVATGDTEWYEVVKWSVYALIEAEELGVTSKNVDQMAKSTDPAVRRFLGVEGNLGQDLGLPNDFAARIIKHVGNYGEVYDRHLGPNSKLNLPRGQNRLWRDGGLLISPPFR